MEVILKQNAEFYARGQARWVFCIRGALARPAAQFEGAAGVLQEWECLAEGQGMGCGCSASTEDRRRFLLYTVKF